MPVLRRLIVHQLKIMATRIQNKRSSIAGKRPDGRYLEPGEIALNTNAADPGVYFETNDGSIAKVGPTFIGVEPPSSLVGYGQGEMWLDSGNGTLNTFNADENRWLPTVGSPHGGAQTVVYVGSEYPEASDSLSNDGSGRPFKTLNRACIEVARRSILFGRNDDPFNARFVIALLPGANVAYNEPGISQFEFLDSIAPFVNNQDVSLETLRLFNSESGGVILPRGTSIVGADMRKTHIRPTFYPKWTREAYENPEVSLDSRTGILKWTGNSYISNLTFLDKTSKVSVQAIEGAESDPALLTSLRPHGYRTVAKNEDGDIIYADTVTLEYPSNVSQKYKGDSVTSPGEYLVEPVDTFKFRLLFLDGSYVSRDRLPEFPGVNTNPPEFLRLTYTNTTHHRLSAVTWATTEELNGYYLKVQKAFADLNFGGTINNAEVNPGETVIVSAMTTDPTPALDTVDNTSPYIYNTSLRSEWGMCGLTNDGSLVSGFRSALGANFTTVSLQNDSDVFEVYYNKAWISLNEATALASGKSVNSITNVESLAFLIEQVRIEDLRFYYRAASDISSNSSQSSGLTDPDSDTRHYSSKAIKTGFIQLVNAVAVGPAVNYWAEGGGQISLTSAGSNFGGEAVRAEGFRGIGTLGGALEPDQGFNLEGIRRPAAITNPILIDPANHVEIGLNSEVAIADNSTHSITLIEPFDHKSIAPYTLRPGSVIWVTNLFSGLKFSATLTNSPLTNNGRTLNFEASGDDITSQEVNQMSLPYVRRFADPRTQAQRTYQLVLSNTTSGHRPPAIGSILRFAETPSAGYSNLLVNGRQLDPGENGGWNHVFTVMGVVLAEDGRSPSTDRMDMPAAKTAQQYFVTVALGDNTSPWAARTNNQQYPHGSLVTYESRGFYGNKATLTANISTPTPEDDTYSWNRSKSYAQGQLTSNAYINNSYAATRDPNSSDYTESAIYLRGVGPVSSDFYDVGLYDYDDGSANLGLGSPASVFINPNLVVGDLDPSRQAIFRLFRLLGYSSSAISSILTQQRWNSRTIFMSSTFFPSPQGDGYANTNGAFPIEFCVPSKVFSGSHTWEWAGYFNYAKGLSAYQDGPLTQRQRFDFITSQSWGGQVIAEGVNEQGEHVSANIVNVDGRGDALPSG